LYLLRFLIIPCLPGIGNCHIQGILGDIHADTVENVWSLFKRSVIGSYHKLSTKHLDAYLNELEWRFNNRDNPYLFRDTLLKLIQSGNLTYDQLKTK